MIIEAIENPFVRVIGHPTGRLINRRPAYDVDINAVVVDDNLSLTRREIYSYLFFSTKSRVAVKDLCHYWWITNFFRKLGRFQNEMNE